MKHGVLLLLGMALLVANACELAGHVRAVPAQGRWAQLVAWGCPPSMWVPGPGTLRLLSPCQHFPAFPTSQRAPRALRPADRQRGVTKRGLEGPHYLRRCLAAAGSHFNAVWRGPSALALPLTTVPRTAVSCNTARLLAPLPPAPSLARCGPRVGIANHCAAQLPPAPHIDLLPLPPPASRRSTTGSCCQPLLPAAVLPAASSATLPHLQGWRHPPSASTGIGGHRSQSQHPRRQRRSTRPAALSLPSSCPTGGCWPVELGLCWLPCRIEAAGHRRCWRCACDG